MVDYICIVFFALVLASPFVWLGVALRNSNQEGSRPDVAWSTEKSPLAP